MDLNNPYAAPQVELVEAQAPRQLSGWSTTQLQILGWLSLLSVLLSLSAAVASFFSASSGENVELAANMLSTVSTFLGCYLFWRLKVFLEQRFSADGLLPPFALAIALSFAADFLQWIWGGEIFSNLGWQTVAYVGVLVLSGLAILWVGIALLRVRGGYQVLRVMAWLEIAGGAMFASVILALLAIIPLVGGSIAMTLVFFRGARELEGSQAA